MATPTIPNGEEYFFPIIYEGNGGGQRVGKFVPFTDNGTINNSCIIDNTGATSQYLSATAGASPTSTQQFTLSFWIKLNKLGTTQTPIALASVGSPHTQRPVVNFTANNEFQWVTSGGVNVNVKTNRTFEDTSKWYHVLIRIDTTQGGNDNNRIYIDGEQQALTHTQDAGDNSNYVLASQPQAIGSTTAVAQKFTGYLAEINYVDGQSLGPDTFGVTDTSTGRWIPKTLSGITYGNNGFRLQFGTSSAMGDDTANSNDFSLNNIDATNQTTDSPTQNFATFDPNDDTGTMPLSQGNREATQSGSSSGAIRGTLAPSSGKYYFEFTAISVAGSDGYGGVGIQLKNEPVDAATSIGTIGANTYIYRDDGRMIHDGNGESGFTNYGSGAIIGVALDLDNGKLYFSYSSGAGTDGVFENSGDPVAGTGFIYTLPSNQRYAPYLVFKGNSGQNYSLNTGQTSFNTTPPTGFSALQQDNLPETSKGVADLVWVKARDDGTLFHVLYNSSRGARTFLYPNGTQAEQGENGSANTTLVDGVQKFLKGGFSVEDQTNVNQSGNSFVSWNWSCNSGTTESISAGGGIDVASTVQKNTTAGFSIVEFTTPSSTQDFTTGHGLSVAPRVFFFKRLDSTSGWAFYHQDNFDANGTEHTLFLNLNNASYAPNPGTAFYPSATTATTFSLRAGASIATSANCVAYCFNEVEGFSKFGKYTGNGDPDGPFVYTGFKPAWIMIKQTNSTGGWIMTDTKRSPFNPVDKLLSANLTNTESTFTSLDILSNGFKQRNTDTGFNGSSSTYIYMAFAEHPFVGDGTNPVTAR